MKLSFSQIGDEKPPLIIMHGLFGSARNWQGIAKQLSDRYTVYALDLRNHGSSAHADKMDYPSMVLDVIEFLDTHNISDAVILGHSMGGKVAMELAMTFPDRVNKLVIVDIAPVAYKHNFDDILQALNSVPVESINSRKDADELLSEKIDVVSLRQFLLQNLVPNPLGGYQWRVNLRSIEQNMDNIMGFPTESSSVLFNKETLFISGEKSTYLAPRYLRVAEEMFPNASVHSVPNAGHWPHIESPAKFLNYLNTFLNQ